MTIWDNVSNEDCDVCVVLKSGLNKHIRERLLNDQGGVDLCRSRKIFCSIFEAEIFYFGVTRAEIFFHTRKTYLSEPEPEYYFVTDTGRMAEEFDSL